jgi:glycosyltransferase involved in cell wall biosynthesis
MDSSPSVSVVIATRDRPADLARLLPGIAAQTHRGFSCIVVDQSSDPGANADAIARMADDRFIHVPTATRGKSKALNLGLASADAPIVAFTDDDCTVPVQWLETALTALSGLGPSALVFGCVSEGEHDETEAFVPAIAFDRDRRLTGPLNRSPDLLGMGANMVVTRQLFVECGGFDEDLGPGGVLYTGEDCELAYRALRHGASVLQSSRLDLVHWGARPRAGNVARDLVTTGFYAIGAGYGKHLRDGDARTLLVILHETLLTAAEILGAVVRNRRPFHVRRLSRFWRGIVDGWRRPLNVPAIAPLDPSPSPAQLGRTA